MDEENERDFSKKTWKEDLTLLVDGKELHVAKNVLAYVSPVFEAMFSHPFLEQDKQELELPGKDYESFAEFLRCIYPGKGNQISADNVFQVIPLADEYQVKHVIEVCERFLLRFIMTSHTSLQDILKCLALAEHLQMTTIKDACVQVIETWPPGDVAEAEVAPICKETMFGIMRKLLYRQHVAKVKQVIRKGLNKESECDSIFEGNANVKGTIIQFAVGNVSNITVKESPAVVVRGIQFSVLIRQTERDNKTFLGLFLKATPENDVPEWSVRVIVRLMILNNSREDIHDKPIERTFTNAAHDWGYLFFLQMSDVLDPSKGFVQDGEIHIAVAFLATDSAT